MHVPDDPGAAAAEAARHAAERASALQLRRALRAETSAAERGTIAQGAVEDARIRHQLALSRLRAGLLRSAAAHDRAAAEHDRAADHGGSAAEHHRRAEAHRAGAEADRRRAEDIPVT